MSTDFDLDNPKISNLFEYYSPRKYVDIYEAFRELYSVNGQQLSLDSLYSFGRSFNQYVGAGAVFNPNNPSVAADLKLAIEDDRYFASWGTEASRAQGGLGAATHIEQKYEEVFDRFKVARRNSPVLNLLPGIVDDAFEFLDLSFFSTVSTTEHFSSLLGFPEAPEEALLQDPSDYTSLKKSLISMAANLQTHMTVSFVSGTVINYMSRGLSQSAAEHLQTEILTETGMGMRFLSPHNLNIIQSRLDNYFAAEAHVIAAEGQYDPSMYIASEILNELRAGEITFLPTSEFFDTYISEDGRVVLIGDPNAPRNQNGQVNVYAEDSNGVLISSNDPDFDADVSLKELLEEVRTKALVDSVHCFAAGTSINLADGTKKPIEQIKIGDEVLAYNAADRNGQGALSSRRVTRTYATPDKLVIDFHGLKVTPGHVFLCGDGEFAGEHRMLMEILRSDGTIVSTDGTVLRAATNAPVESREDAFLQVAYLTDANDALMQSGKMRAGTLILMPEDESKTVLACLEEEGYRFDAETGLVAKDGEEPHPLYWYGEIPRPEDYILKRSKLTDADLYAEPGYHPEAIAVESPSRLEQGFTPAEGTLYLNAGMQAGETIH